MTDLRSRLRPVARALRAAWRTRLGKTTAVLLVLAPWLRLARWALLLPALWYGIRFARALMRRWLWSVRAKLAAFYVYAAVLPILLVATVLYFGGYFVLGQVSARVVEGRLDRQVEWAEQRVARLERAYWRMRAAGADAATAASTALLETYEDVAIPGFGCWAGDAAGRLLAVRGVVDPADLRVPAWLGDQRFAGIVAIAAGRLELRTRLRIVEPGGAVELGCRLPVDGRILNGGLPGAEDELRAGLGSPDRSLRECSTLPDSMILRQGIVAYLLGAGDRALSPSPLLSQDAPHDTTHSRLRLRPSAERPSAAAAHDSAYRQVPGLAPDRLRSRFGLLRWFYVGYPVVWETGSTVAVGPPIVIAFSVEGAARELLRTGVGADARPVIFVFASIVAFLVLLQGVTTLLGFGYARAISRAVARLDRGVRAVRAGDFGHRIASKERDQMGALSLAFDDMAVRLQGLLEERAAVQAFERELAIARDVQARLFPARVPYAPFLEVAGVCVPARTVSGDYYDFLVTRQGYDAVVADVSGKGMSAALLMASLHSALRSLYPRHERGPAPELGEIVTRLNDHLHEVVEPTRFVTLFMARYAGDGRLAYCNAGHNPAALVQDGRVEWLSSGGLMLGPFPDLVYEPSIVAVRPGDLICIYTDGVTEAEAPSSEQFGEERLARVLRDTRGEAPGAVLEAIQEAVRAWRDGGEPGDDVTLVLLRVTA